MTLTLLLHQSTNQIKVRVPLCLLPPYTPYLSPGKTFFTSPIDKPPNASELILPHPNIFKLSSKFSTRLTLVPIPKLPTSLPSSLIFPHPSSSPLFKIQYTSSFLPTSMASYSIHIVRTLTSLLPGKFWLFACAPSLLAQVDLPHPTPLPHTATLTQPASPFTIQMSFL